MSAETAARAAQDEAFEQKLLAYIAEHDVKAEHLHFEKSCHSVREAAEAAHVTPEDFLKSICLMTGTGQLVVAIVKGEDRASTTRVQEALSGAECRIATPQEMLERTGYPAGGTPPFGFDAVFLIDERVMEKPVIFGGGGSEHALVKLNPMNLQRANNARVARVRQ